MTDKQSAGTPREFRFSLMTAQSCYVAIRETAAQKVLLLSYIHRLYKKVDLASTYEK